jgi:hypothetical protein
VPAQVLLSTPAPSTSSVRRDLVRGSFDLVLAFGFAFAFSALVSLCVRRQIHQVPAQVLLSTPAPWTSVLLLLNQQIENREGAANALRGKLEQKKAVEKQLDLKLQSSSFELAEQKKILDGEEAVNKAIGEKIIAAQQTLKEQQQAKAKLSKEANTSGVLSGGGDGGNEGLEQLQLQQKHDKSSTNNVDCPSILKVVCPPPGNGAKMYVPPHLITGVVKPKCDIQETPYLIDMFSSEGRNILDEGVINRV